MKIEIDHSLFRFQLKTLLTDKVSLAQLLVFHWWVSGLVFAKKGLAAGAAPDGALWVNYGLLICACVTVLMGGICAGFTLVKPRVFGMVELLLASPLSLRKLIGTSFFSCFLFSAVNLGVHFAVIHARFGLVPHGAGFYAALAAVLAFSALFILGAVLVSLRRKDADQLHIVFIAVAMIFVAAGMLTRLSLNIPAWLPPSLAAAFLVGAYALWAALPRLINKEKAVLA